MLPTLRHTCMTVSMYMYIADMKEKKRKYLMIMMVTKQIFSEQSKNISVLFGAMFPAAAVMVSFFNIFFFSFFNNSC